jgi:hypothetical protein
MILIFPNIKMTLRLQRFYLMKRTRKIDSNNTVSQITLQAQQTT